MKLNPNILCFMCQYLSLEDVVTKMAVLSTRIRKAISKSKEAGSRSITLDFGGLSGWNIIKNYQENCRKFQEEFMLDQINKKRIEEPASFFGFKSPRPARQLGLMSSVCTNITLLATFKSVEEALKLLPKTATV
jgi:hypothetical protein